MLPLCVKLAGEKVIPRRRVEKKVTNQQPSISSFGIILLHANIMLLVRFSFDMCVYMCARREFNSVLIFSVQQQRILWVITVLTQLSDPTHKHWHWHLDTYRCGFAYFFRFVAISLLRHAFLICRGANLTSENRLKQQHQQQHQQQKQTVESVRKKKKTYEHYAFQISSRFTFVMHLFCIWNVFSACVLLCHLF